MGPATLAFQFGSSTLSLLVLNYNGQITILHTNETNHINKHDKQSSAWFNDPLFLEDKSDWHFWNNKIVPIGFPLLLSFFLPFFLLVYLLCYGHCPAKFYFIFGISKESLYQVPPNVHTKCVLLGKCNWVAMWLSNMLSFIHSIFYFYPDTFFCT